MYNFKNEQTKKKIISVSVSLVMLLSGCSLKINDSQPITVSTTGEVMQTSSESSPQAYATYESETTESNEFTLSYDIETLRGFGEFLDEQGYNFYRDNMPYTLGYDNPYLNNLLSEYCFITTGGYPSSISAADLNYFQHNSNYVTDFGRTSDSSISGYSDLVDESLYPTNLASIRNAILIENNLRFLIDEIPYSYFETRFPEFVSDQSATYQDELNSQYAELLTRIYVESENRIDLSGLSDYEYDLLLYKTCRIYNATRSILAYSCNITMTRDESTGRNILAPSENQLEQLNDTFGQYFGGDVMQVETREHFYETYGMYPEDALYRETRYEGNLTESNSMNSEAPSRQR